MIKVLSDKGLLPYFGSKMEKHITHKRRQNIFVVVRNGYRLFRINDPLILAAATAFFTTFAISPIIIILINLLTLYFNKESIRLQLFSKLASTFGKQTANEIEAIVDNFRVLQSSTWVTAASFLFFLFIATTLLSVIRHAIHRIWKIHMKPTTKFGYNIKERVVGIVIILLIGLLFLIALLMDTSIAVFRNYLHDILPAVNVTLIRIVNIVFSLIVVTIWFTMVFKILPEARVQWKVAFAGGFATAILFTAGKFVMGKFLLYGRIATIFGASASIALLLLFIFYTSLILYFGTAFTHEYGKLVNKPILPGRFADSGSEDIL